MLSSRSRAAFTLIELLTVISIIAVLMALLFPAIGTVRENARKVQAKTDATSVVAAVKAYHTEYGKYPSLADIDVDPEKDLMVGDADIQGTRGDNNALFDIIRAREHSSRNPDHKLNPRRISFLETRIVPNPTKPRGGFLDKQPQGGSGGGNTGSEKLGCFFDPWGRQYNVMMDSNYDEIVDLSEIYRDYPSRSDCPRVGVAVFALGRDEKIGEPKSGLTDRLRDGNKVADDVTSWQ